MAAATDPEQVKKKSGLVPLLLGLVLAAVLGGVGFFVVYSGMAVSGRGAAHQGVQVPGFTPVEFVPIEPILVSLAGEHEARHLRFRAELEVEPGQGANVESLMPRIMDVLNGYLRAVDPSELEKTTALVRLRAQLLRRIQLVVGEERVRDLLVTEFVLN